MKGEGYIRSSRFLHPHNTIVAYKESDRLVIMGKRVLVDVERGRTVRGWKPRRLGGGLGGRPKPEQSLPLSGRGGFRAPERSDRGGFRGRGGGGGGYGGRGGGFRGGGGGFRGGRDDYGGGGRGGGYGGGGFRYVLCSLFPQSPLIGPQVAAGVVLATKAGEDSVSTRMADLEGRRTDLVGMALLVMDSEVVVVTGVVAGDSVHPEVAVGMEVGTVPTLNGRAQGWTRIAIQSDQGIEHIFRGGLHDGVSLLQRFSAYSLSLSLVFLPSLPPTCCVSIQYLSGCSANIPATSQESRNYHIIMFS